MEIKYDTSVEVTKAQYHHLMNEFDSIVCGRIDNITDKCYIKCWNMRYGKFIVRALKNLK